MLQRVNLRQIVNMLEICMSYYLLLLLFNESTLVKLKLLLSQKG